MKAVLLAFALAFSFSAQAGTICQDIKKIESKLTLELEALSLKIDSTESGSKVEGYLHRYEEVYNQLTEVKAQYVDLCLN